MMLGVSQLPQLEQDAIAALLCGEGVPRELVEQAKRIESVIRDASSSGVYVDFVLMNDTAPLEGLRNFHIADLSAATGDSKDLEFMLYVREGFIACLEVYSIYDVLPPYQSVVGEFHGAPKVYE